MAGAALWWAGGAVLALPSHPGLRGGLTERPH